jgi:hypothetical protein
MAILQPGHVTADLLPAAALLPQFSGLDDRQRHFLAGDGFHFFSNNPFYTVFNPLTDRQIRKNTGGNLSDQPRPQHKLMADQFRFGLFLSKRLKKESG